MLPRDSRQVAPGRDAIYRQPLDAQRQIECAFVVPTLRQPRNLQTGIQPPRRSSQTPSSSPRVTISPSASPSRPTPAPRRGNAARTSAREMPSVHKTVPRHRAAPAACEALPDSKHLAAAPRLQFPPANPPKRAPTRRLLARHRPVRGSGLARLLRPPFAHGARHRSPAVLAELHLPAPSLAPKISAPASSISSMWPVAGSTARPSTTCSPIQLAACSCVSY